MRRLVSVRSHVARRSGECSAGKARRNSAHSRWAVRSLTFQSAAYSAWVGQWSILGAVRARTDEVVQTSQAFLSAFSRLSPSSMRLMVATATSVSWRVIRSG